MPDTTVETTSALNTELVQYWNGQKEFGCQMVWYSNAIYQISYPLLMMQVRVGIWGQKVIPI